MSVRPAVAAPPGQRPSYLIPGQWRVIMPDCDVPCIVCGQPIHKGETMIGENFATGYVHDPRCPPPRLRLIRGEGIVA